MSSRLVHVATALKPEATKVSRYRGLRHVVTKLEAEEVGTENGVMYVRPSKANKDKRNASAETDGYELRRLWLSDWTK